MAGIVLVFDPTRLVIVAFAVEGIPDNIAWTGQLVAIVV
jgi:hypothetical protein